MAADVLLMRVQAPRGGLERYRQCNIGSQQAFIDARRDAFEGAPAAGALATAGDTAGGLSLCFLAPCVAPRPVDNPRQVPACRYSSLYGPRAPSYSGAAWADAGGGGVAAQTQETLRSLQAVIDSAHRACTARLTLADLQPTVYVRHAADDAKVLDLLAQSVPAWRAAPCVQADVCHADLLVEIEAHALAPGALA